MFKFCHPISTKQAIGIIVGLYVLLTLSIITVYQNSGDHSNILQKEIRKFAFAKNHKCGSSTIGNIILRFAQKKQLNIVLPMEGVYLSHTQLFNRNALEDVVWRNVSYDIFSAHSRWHRKEIMAVLKQEVPTFCIVRNPVDLFVSLFHFVIDLRYFFGVDDIHHLVQEIKFDSQSPILNNRLSGKVGRNQLAWDMGLSPDIFENQTEIQKEIERLDKEFDLVMISERMDESLILLKELLHWPMENVVHLDLNRRKPENSPTLSVKERKILSEWLAADVQIFEHFSRRFDERVAELNKKYYTPRSLSSKTFVMKETELLKQKNKQLYDRCVLKEVDNKDLDKESQWYGNGVLGYVINQKQEDCALCTKSDQVYYEYFRNLLMESQKRIERSRAKIN